jgi:hypothetical protein
LVASESGRKLRGAVRGELRSSSRVKRKRSDVVHADICELLVTGCRDSQTSADAYIKGSYNGALTYYLVESMRDANGKLSYRELHKRTLAKLKGEYDQVPQLEGNKSKFDRLFLSPEA